MQETGRFSRIMFEKRKPNNRLNCVVQYTKSVPVVNVYVVSVEKWKIGVAVIGFAFCLTCLLAAILIVVYAQMPGLYMESCKGRSCTSGLNLKCVNNTCVCTSNEFYSKSCEKKKTYSEHCSLLLPCEDGKSLLCRDGVCKCNSTSYWKSTSCTPKKGYKQDCSNTSQCLNDLLMLTCDSISKKCLCNSARYLYSPIVTILV